MAFRIMHNPAIERDFKPPAIKRLNGPHPGDRCEMFALSFFATAAAAQRQFASLVGRMKENAKARYGDAIGELALEKEDGLLSEPNGNGHIDLHEDDPTPFVNRVLSYAVAKMVSQGSVEEVPF
jgi:hypothetical protein